MSAIVQAQLPTTDADIERSLSHLSAGKAKLPRLTLAQRRELLEDCLRRVVQLAPEWVDSACEAKGISPGSPMRAEEVAAGPLATARHLRLLIINYRALEQSGAIKLPAPPERGPHGGWRVQVMPAQGLYDPIVFAGFKAHSWLAPEVSGDDLSRLGHELVQPCPAQCVLVLGAGNVSSIPATDAISKIFQEGHVVLLKMNPVNEYLGPIFARLFTRLIEADLVRVVYGGADVGAAAIEHAEVDQVHITGSIHTHDAIVWGPPGQEQEQRRRDGNPLLHKPITSELGNVSPWIIVPGRYSPGQLRFQAESVAASITNNASFNCVATKVIVTSQSWPQRQEFLDLLDAVLAEVPRRRAYYPGAIQRYGRFAGRPVSDASEMLPWTLLRDADPLSAPHLFREESFVCVCAEIGLVAGDERMFLPAAVDFVNEKLWGTLSAAVTLPAEYRKDAGLEASFQSSLAGLRYGAVGINHWPALVYAMMSPPWGGFPGSTLDDVQSGTGTVHNTFMLPHVQKTVLEGPLTIAPKPFWFPTHRRPEPLAWKVMHLYAQPSPWKLPGLMLAALGG